LRLLSIKQSASIKAGLSLLLNEYGWKLKRITIIIVLAQAGVNYIGVYVYFIYTSR
jgi:hypothetical protein